MSEIFRCGAVLILIIKEILCRGLDKDKDISYREQEVSYRDLANRTLIYRELVQRSLNQILYRSLLKRSCGGPSEMLPEAFS